MSKPKKKTTSLAIAKSKKSKARDIQDILNGKKISNATQDVLKSMNGKMSIKDALAKLDKDNALAGQSNRTSKSNSDAMNEFTKKFNGLIDEFVKSGKFTREGKVVTVKNANGEIRIPKRYFATVKDVKK
tara:strand:- start:1648 stop:2037 length:390 start_codon:yes stop_codon:yes gene_type:complete